MDGLLKRIKDKDQKTRKEMRRGFIGKFSLTEKELQVLYSNITNLRDLALIKLAVFTGIRREDIVAIELSNIDWSTGRISYYETKKRRTWKVHINPDTLNILTMYINTLDKHEKFLFPGRHDKIGAKYSKGHLTGRAAYNILQTWLRKSGFEERPFHALRSTCIKLLKSKGWTDEQIMAQTGDSLEVLQEHYLVPTDSEMENVARDTDTGIPEREASKEELMNNLDKRWTERRDNQ